MGNVNCCNREKNYYCDEEYKYYSKKSDLFLKRKKRKLIKDNKCNMYFVFLYSNVSIVTIIVIFTGGPASMIISGIISMSFFIYYNKSILDTNKEIDKIDHILAKRKDDEISIYEQHNYIISKK